MRGEKKLLLLINSEEISGKIVDTFKNKLHDKKKEESLTEK
jgi:hypothetical protein